MFEQLLRQLWRGVLIEATMGDSVAGAAAARPFPDLRRHRMTREEVAVQRWLQALQVISLAHCLSYITTLPHIALLQHNLARHHGEALAACPPGEFPCCCLL